MFVFKTPQSLSEAIRAKIKEIPICKLLKLIQYRKENTKNLLLKILSSVTCLQIYWLDKNRYEQKMSFYNRQPNVSKKFISSTSIWKKSYTARRTLNIYNRYLG